LVTPNERRLTPRCAKAAPSRRVAFPSAPCGVTSLGNGITIAGGSCLAWRAGKKQRKCDLLADKLYV